ncbi:hypothetical protein [Streptomyces clavuligerus]|uniref:hypothetical protein n=1 Tax=Streptomyces clavuligerus TaxID=1901 RepID=UPI00020D9154|nr:hypothetical protein [Streptomyces clavuligerus]
MLLAQGALEGACPVGHDLLNARTGLGSDGGLVGRDTESFDAPLNAVRADVQRRLTRLG